MANGYSHLCNFFSKVRMSHKEGNTALAAQLFWYIYSYPDTDLLLKVRKHQAVAAWVLPKATVPPISSFASCKPSLFLASPSFSHSSCCCWKKRSYCLNDRGGYPTAYTNTGLVSTSVPQKRYGLVHIEYNLSSSLKLCWGVYISFPNPIRQKNKEPHPYHKQTNQAYENSSIETYGFSVIWKL